MRRREDTTSHLKIVIGRVWERKERPLEETARDVGALRRGNFQLEGKMKGLVKEL